MRVIYDSPEYTHPMNIDEDFGFKKRYNATKTKIGKLKLKEKQKLYYLFDFGDDWWHELTVLKIQNSDGSKDYPRITRKAGESPEQYPDYEEYEEDEF